jgi:hypothetical protein
VKLSDGDQSTKGPSFRNQGRYIHAFNWAWFKKFSGDENLMTESMWDRGDPRLSKHMPQHRRLSETGDQSTLLYGTRPSSISEEMLHIQRNQKI